MGKFDITSEYNENIKLNLMELSREISEEISAKFDKQQAERQKNNASPDNDNLNQKYLGEADQNLIDPNVVCQKLTNSNNSGLLNKLEKLLHFDMLKIAGESNKEYFDMLKILKVLYYIEKPKKADERVLITDILAKPQPGNIPAEASQKSVYGDVFQNLYEKIYSAADDADERCYALESIDTSWKFITVQSFNYLLSSQALDSPDKAYAELIRIKNYLSMLYEKLKKVPLSAKIRPESVMNTFFNILACHKLLCIETGKISVNQKLELPPSPNPVYTEKFRESETQPVVSWDILKRLDDRLDGVASDKTAEYILRLVAYNPEIPDDDIKHYHYAVKHARTIIKWWNNYLQIEDNDFVSIDLLCVVMQEIIYCKKFTPKVSHNYLGQKNPGISMLGVLSHPDKADPVVVHAWMIRLENRLCTNLGNLNLLQCKREIDNIIYEIKKIIYSYHNLHDLLFVNSHLTECAKKATVSSAIAQEYGDYFKELILNYINTPENHPLRFQTENPNVLNLFREFIVHHVDSDYILTEAKNIAQIIVQAFNSEANGLQTEYVFQTLLPPHSMASNHSRLILRMNTETDTVELVDYQYILSFSYKSVIKMLRLDAFID